MAVLYTKVTSIEFTGEWTHEPWGLGTKSTAGEGASAVIHRDGEPDVTLSNPPSGTTVKVNGTTAIVE